MVSHVVSSAKRTKTVVKNSSLNYNFVTLATRTLLVTRLTINHKSMDFKWVGHTDLWTNAYATSEMDTKY